MSTLAKNFTLELILGLLKLSGVRFWLSCDALCQIHMHSRQVASFPPTLNVAAVCFDGNFGVCRRSQRASKLRILLLLLADLLHPLKYAEWVGGLRVHVWKMPNYACFFCLAAPSFQIPEPPSQCIHYAWVEYYMAYHTANYTGRRCIVSHTYYKA